MTNIDEITSSNDAVIAFYRLHCLLSRKIKGLEHVKKYNLWKPLLSFYCKSNKFNFFIQNSCTEYIENLITTEPPNELTLFIEVLNTCIGCIKNAIEKQYPLSDGVIFRSLRILHVVFSKHLFHFNENCLRMIAKQCSSLDSYIRHLLVISKDDFIINYSLKIFIFSRVFLSNIENVKNEGESFRRFVAVANELLIENEKFSYYMSEIFSLELLDEKEQSILRKCSLYLKMKTIVEYLTKLNVASSELTEELDLLIPKSEIFDNFLRLYLVQLLSQDRISTVALNILKNVSNDRSSSDESVRIHFIRLYELTLKLASSDAYKPSEELNNLSLNVIHALSTLIVKEGKSFNDEKVISDLIKTLLHIIQPNFRHSMILRLSAFKLCHLILRKFGITSDEIADLLRASIILGMNDSCWEVRDSALEVLNETLKGKGCSFVNQEICESLLNTLEDEESFVRATAYVVLTTSCSFKNKELWTTCFDYNKLLYDIERRFQKETEDNVRENMIGFIIEAWRSFRIPDELLISIYETIYKASTRDLHSEVRRKGMMFWKNLVDLLKEDRVSQHENVFEFFEKLCYSGCFQAIISGIEDEYDEKVSDIASEALQILKSIDLTSSHLCELTNEKLGVSIDEYLMNKLPSSSLVKSNFLSTKQFISTYLNSEIGRTEEQSLQEKEFDLNNMMKCFTGVTLEGSEINQKDCY